MYRFIESIKLKEGLFCNLEYHQKRVNESLRKYYPGAEINLFQISIPRAFVNGLFKTRIVYSDIIHQIDFIPYKIRSINKLQIIESNDVDYSFKYQNRETLDEIFSKRGLCDDVIISKFGMITDTSYSNIVLYDEKNYYTPKNPLLKGTKRQYLIDNHVIKEKEIYVNQIKEYSKIYLINSMINLGDVELMITNENICY